MTEFEVVNDMRYVEEKGINPENTARNQNCREIAGNCSKRNKRNSIETEIINQTEKSIDKCIQNNHTVANERLLCSGRTN